MLFLLVMPVKKPEIYFHTKCRWNMAIFRWDKILWFRKTNGCHIRILLLLMCSHRNVIFYLNFVVIQSAGVMTSYRFSGWRPWSQKSTSRFRFSKCAHL